MHTGAAVLNRESMEMDIGIKTILAILLGVATAFCSGWIDFLSFSVYLAVITVWLGSDLKFVAKNLLSYGIVFVFPYLCGILLSLLMNALFSAPMYAGDFEIAFSRMVKIFFIWYIGSLYFFTTPFQLLANMLNQVLSPLNALGVPVAKYLTMASIAVNELTRSLGQFQTEVFEPARNLFKEKSIGMKAKLEELSHLLVAFLAGSLQQTDQIQDQIQLPHADRNPVTVRISKKEIIAVLSFIIFLLVILL